VKIAANRIETREDARYVAIEDGMGPVVGDAENCGGGVLTDARERDGGVPRARKIRRVLRDDFFRGAMQIARAGVVAEAGPEAEYFFFARGG
jgi:predicted Rdx family selenoprotein